jgi:hypothetical protein
MANSAAPLMNIFGTTDYLIPLILEGLSDADARTRAREGRVTGRRSCGTWVTCCPTGPTG